MNNAYADRSRLSFKDFDTEEGAIEYLKIETTRVIEEATAKNLLTQAKLRQNLKTLIPGSPECLYLLKTLRKLHENWEELIELYKQSSFIPALGWNEDYTDYDAMWDLIDLVERFRGKKPAYGSIDEDKLIKIFADLSM